MRYAFIEAERPHHSLSALCRVMKVSRSGFHDWRAARDAGTPVRRDRRARIDRLVREGFERHKGRYGAPRLTRALGHEGHRFNRKTVAESLARQGLRAKARKRFRATTCSRHTLAVSPDLLGQDFTAEAPNRKWVQDITYLWSDQGWSYLAVVIDLYSRRVVGWSLDSRMTVSLVLEAMRMAITTRGRPSGTIAHSDRGSQYCAKEFRALLDEAGLRSSMSRKGCCYDNACAESFFHSLKVEAIHGERITTREELRERVFEYIELDYNRTRLHSTLGYVSPSQFEQATVG